MTSDELVELLLVSPCGVALLDGLERRHAGRSIRTGWQVSPSTSGTARSAAMDELGEMSAGDVWSVALQSADTVAGPWNPRAPANLSNAYRAAAERRDLAEHVAERFVDDLVRPLEPGRQEYWSTISDDQPERRRFRDLSGTYCCGEWPWHGMWTATDPPAESHGDLAEAWELYHGRLIRFRTVMSAEATVHEIHRPSDWVELVLRYPGSGSTPHSGWELPGPNQRRSELGDVDTVSRGRAARVGVRVVMPDWEAVAAEVDAVHLSWAGMLTTEGHVVDVPELGPDVVTMLRYWFSERTLWLSDRVERVEPLHAPHLDRRFHEGRWSSTFDEPFSQLGLADLGEMLGRPVPIESDT